MMSISSLATLLAVAAFWLASGLVAAAQSAADSLSVVLVALLLVVAVAFPATSGLSGGFGRLRHVALHVSTLLVALSGLASAESWSPDLCVRPTGLGSSGGGDPFTILGSAGSSVRRLRVYRNNGKMGYLRGIVVFFSDGTEMRGGVRKDQFADIEFAAGEAVTGLTLWQLTNSTGSRVARIDISTSQQSWGYGVDNTARLSSKAVNVGSGVLVGFQGRAGDDLDYLAPIFLKSLSSSTVSDIVFEKTGDDEGLHLVTLREGSAVYNGTDYSWSFSGNEARDVTTAFTSSMTNTLGATTTFSASIPKIAMTGVTGTWTGATTSTYDQSSGHSAQLSWATSIDLSKDVPAVSCSAMVWEGRLNVAWTGTQTVVANGEAVSFPVSGTLTHVAYGKVETVCRPLQAVAKRWTA